MSNIYGGLADGTVTVFVKRYSPHLDHDITSNLCVWCVYN